MRVVHRACGLGFRPGFRHGVLSFVGEAEDLGAQKVTTSKINGQVAGMG